MIRTQVEVQNAQGTFKVYWLDHNPHEHRPLKAGHGIRISEEGFCRINRIFTTLNTEDLPVKAKIGTIVELN